MDQRKTFNSTEELLSILNDLFHHKHMAYMLIDEDGLTRIDGGLITAIDQNQELNQTYITVGDFKTFPLEKVIAVNGIFQSDYSEC